jgi:hypothetical protein|tara:strand:- start:1661 stop:2131 length:471 start_codon:yes stop_codon:yes gene_type:complete
MSSFGKLFRTLSAINGWSLVIVGGLSLLASLAFGAWAGAAVSLAAAFHGIVELVLRKRALIGNQGDAVRWMALNQLGLAASLSLYFAYQVMILDADALSLALMQPPLSDLLSLYPESRRSQLVDMLPLLIAVFYALVAGVSWVVCGVTAIFYWKQR